MWGEGGVVVGKLLLPSTHEAKSGTCARLSLLPAPFQERDSDVTNHSLNSIRTIIPKTIVCYGKISLSSVLMIFVNPF